MLLLHSKANSGKVICPMFTTSTSLTLQVNIRSQEQWGQCDSFSKWRRLPADVLLPSKWTCSENVWDKERCSCSAPDEISTKDLERIFKSAKGYTSGCSAGDTVPYIVCCEQGHGSSSSAGIAQRARHPDELRKDNENLMIDIDYYLAQQIHPVVSRLRASIEGTSPSVLADCLGLDPSKFQSKSIEVANNDHPGSVICLKDGEERYYTDV